MKMTIRDLEFAYGQTKVLRGVSFDVKAGELTTILGPNGAGKSTLIKAMDRLITPQKGSIAIDGQNIVRMSREKLARKIGYVPQMQSGVFSLTVFDTVFLGRRAHMKEAHKPLHQQKVLDALKALNIEKLAMKNLNTLSGGQQQKVIIARAIAQETDILLLDEATSALDVRHQMEVMEIISRLVKSSETTAIMIVHDLNLAARYSDNIIIMKDGRIAAAGRPEEVLTSENISLVYGVEARINHIDGRPYIVPLKLKSA